MKVILIFIFFIFLGDAYLIAQCYDSYDLLTQNDVDSFQIKYGPCTEVSTLTIDNSNGDIISLEPLTGINKIGLFELFVGDNLSSLRGLDSLNWVQVLDYRSKYKLSSNPIKNLDTILFIFYEFKNENNDLSLFENVKYSENIRVVNTGSLIGMKALHPSDKLSISINSNDSIVGLDKLLVNSKRLSLLWVYNCNGIFSLKGLEHLDSINALYFRRLNNTIYKNITSIKNVNYLLFEEGDYSADIKKIFKNIDNLKALYLKGINNLTSIDDILPNLNSIQNTIWLENNNELIDISKFEYFNLPHNSGFSIRLNDVIHYYNIYIKDNPNLNYCNYDFFCRAIKAYPDSIILEGNGGGCDIETISEYCEGYVPITEIYDTICYGDTYVYGDSIVNKSGYYIDTLQSVSGEDSIVLALNLTVHPIDSFQLDTMICNDKKITIGKADYSEGKYEIILTNQYGCDSIIMANIEVSALEIDTVDITPDYGCANGSINIKFLDADNPPYAYKWSTEQSGKILKNLSEGNYSLTVSDNIDCPFVFDDLIVADSAAYLIPNAFFPSNSQDDINSTFKIYCGKGTNILSTEIYNRWGEKIFQSDDNTPWDGTFRGKTQTPGVYLYKIVFDSPCGVETETGQVMLLR